MIEPHFNQRKAASGGVSATACQPVVHGPTGVLERVPGGPLAECLIVRNQTEPLKLCNFEPVQMGCFNSALYRN